MTESTPSLSFGIQHSPACIQLKESYLTISTALSTIVIIGSVLALALPGISAINTILPTVAENHAYLALLGGISVLMINTVLIAALLRRNSNKQLSDEEISKIDLSGVMQELEPGQYLTFANYGIVAKNRSSEELELYAFRHNGDYIAKLCSLHSLKYKHERETHIFSRNYVSEKVGTAKIYGWEHSLIDIGMYLEKTFTIGSQSVYALQYREKRDSKKIYYFKNETDRDRVKAPYTDQIAFDKALESAQKNAVLYLPENSYWPHEITIDGKTFYVLFIHLSGMIKSSCSNELTTHIDTINDLIANHRLINAKAVNKFITWLNKNQVLAKEKSCLLRRYQLSTHTFINILCQRKGDEIEISFPEDLKDAVQGLHPIDERGEYKNPELGKLLNPFHNEEKLTEVKEQLLPNEYYAPNRDKSQKGFLECWPAVIPNVEGVHVIRYFSSTTALTKACEELIDHEEQDHVLNIAVQAIRTALIEGGTLQSNESFIFAVPYEYAKRAAFFTYDSAKEEGFNLIDYEYIPLDQMEKRVEESSFTNLADKIPELDSKEAVPSSLYKPLTTLAMPVETFFNPKLKAEQVLYCNFGCFGLATTKYTRAIYLTSREEETRKRHEHYEELNPKTLST